MKKLWNDVLFYHGLGLNHSPTSATVIQSKKKQHFIFLGTLNLSVLPKFIDVVFTSNTWQSKNLRRTAEYLSAALQRQTIRIGLAELGEQPELLSGRWECRVNRKWTQWIICTSLFDIFSDRPTAVGDLSFSMTEADCGALCHWWLGGSHVSAYPHCSWTTSFIL